MKNENTGDIKGKVIVYLLSVILGFVTTFIVMLIFAALGVFLDLSDGFATPFASVGSAVGGVISAFTASKKIGYGGLFNGLVCGGIMFFIIVASALMMTDSGLTLNTLFNFVIIMLSSLIGGVWGVNQKPKKII